MGIPYDLDLKIDVKLHMKKLPAISGKELIKILQQRGYEITRIKGSHHRLMHPNGSVTTVPIHKNDPLPKGLLHKIITKDIEITIEDFLFWIN